jgi:hypothetical protein
MNRSFKFHLNNKVIFSILYLYFLITSFLIIPAGDDFFWWGKPGHYLLTHHFYGLDSSFGGSSNGRYLGNLLEILIMHSSIFCGNLLRWYHYDLYLVFMVLNWPY